MKPLESFRVLHLTNVLASPFCSHQLAHLGAEVIKIEIPGRGDQSRQLETDPERETLLIDVSMPKSTMGTMG